MILKCFERGFSAYSIIKWPKFISWNNDCESADERTSLSRAKTSPVWRCYDWDMPCRKSSFTLGFKWSRFNYMMSLQSMKLRASCGKPKELSLKTSDSQLPIWPKMVVECTTPSESWENHLTEGIEPVRSVHTNPRLQQLPCIHFCRRGEVSNRGICKLSLHLSTPAEKCSKSRSNKDFALLEYSIQYTCQYLHLPFYSFPVFRDGI